MDVILIIILLAYCALQMTAVFAFGDSYFLADINEKNGNDDVKYIRSALNLIEKGKFYYQDEDIAMDIPTVFIMPGYPVFLALCLKLFGLSGGLLAVRIVQGLLQMGVLLLIYLIGKKYFNVWTGRLAAAFYLFYIPNLETPLYILTEPIFTFFFVLLIYLSLIAVESKKLKYYVWGGIVLGLAVLIRPTILLFPIVILVVWLLKKYSIKEIFKRTWIVGGILILLLAPWWIRNAAEFGRFIPLTVAQGDPFMQGASYMEFDMSNYQGYITAGMDSFEIDKAKTEIGKARLQEAWQTDPLRTITWFTIEKFYLLWEYPNYTHYAYPDDQLLYNVSFNTVFRYHWLLIVLAGLGMTLMCLRGETNRRLKLMLPLSIFYMCVIYLPYFAFPRYTYPVMPLVFLLAAVGFCTAAQWLGKDNSKDNNLIKDK